MIRTISYLALGLMLATFVAVWTVGCSGDSRPATRPVKTLVYTDHLVEGGPGYVDVFGIDSDTTTTAPNAAPLKAAIIAIHGGAWHEGARWQVGPIANEFANNGYVVFAPDYSLGPRAHWPAPLVDLQACLRYVRSNAQSFGVDPARIGAWGGSAGGHLATMLALNDDLESVVVTPPRTASGGSGGTTTGSGGSSTGTTPTRPLTLEQLQFLTAQSGRVTCAVDASGPADLTIPEGMAPDEDGILRDFLGAPRAELTIPQLLNASTINYARPDASVLIIHGTTDTFVSILHSQHLNAALTGAHADVSFIQVPGGMHDASTYHEFSAWASTLAYFQRRLALASPGSTVPLTSDPSTK
jgi:acetyl esterase/lipase